MAGYCGRCNKHYDCRYTEHDMECEGEPQGIVQGSYEDFENQFGDADEDVREEMWNKHFR